MSNEGGLKGSETEGSPIMNTDDHFDSPASPFAHPSDAPTLVPGMAEDAGMDVVVAYSPQIPPQLEHWLRKRSKQLQLSDMSELSGYNMRMRNAQSALVDLDALPRDQDPIAVVRQLHYDAPETRILVMTSSGDEYHRRSLLEAGAVAVIIKQPYVADVVFALQAADEGRTYVSGVTTERERAAVQITAREREVLELMANGHSNQAIGERLSISVKTVEAHRARLFKKLGASNVADAVLLAIRTGLVMP
jgi:DNA-binding NarL/FixJ family response regulator